jgi:hypothetical protein
MGLLDIRYTGVNVIIGPVITIGFGPAIVIRKYKRRRCRNRGNNKADKNQARDEMAATLFALCDHHYERHGIYKFSTPVMD